MALIQLDIRQSVISLFCIKILWQSVTSQAICSSPEIMIPCLNDVSRTGILSKITAFPLSPMEAC